MSDADRQYLDILRRILDTGDARVDRTGVGTFSIFGVMARFDLSGGEVPILTTKRVLWKTAIREMLWFLTGNTNIRDLLLVGVRIWTDWPLARYREQTGDPIDQSAFEARVVEDPAFAQRWGDLGPVYGKQWRRWLGSDGKEYDQIAQVIETLRTSPGSRRILFHGWNVAELGAMALPPCHMVYQYHVTSDGRLNGLLFQRSADHFLGVPFNWAGAAALQLMLAQQAGLRPGEMIWMGGDVHLYQNHLDQAHEQLARTPRPAPRLALTRHPDSIDEYAIEDFVLSDYDPHPPIKGAVAV